jgi:hypothetical protein
MTAALEPKFILHLRSLESAPPVHRAEVHALVRDVNALADVLERNWFDLDEELRKPIRLLFYELRERKFSFVERLRYYYFLLRMGPDRATLREYLDAVARLKDVLYDLLERENPDFQDRFAAALERREAASLPDPPPSSPREWSAWLQNL